MTRTKPAEERRADLLAAGEELFLAKGVAATSLDDITSRAGVSKGLFYLYFRSKDELLAAMQDQFSARLADRVRAATDLAGDWPGKLDACVQAIFDSYHERHDLHEILFQARRPRVRQPPGDPWPRARRDQRPARRRQGGRRVRRRGPGGDGGVVLGDHARLRPGLPGRAHGGRRQAPQRGQAAVPPRGRPDRRVAWLTIASRHPRGLPRYPRSLGPDELGGLRSG